MKNPFSNWFDKLKPKPAKLVVSKTVAVTNEEFLSVPSEVLSAMNRPTTYMVGGLSRKVHHIPMAEALALAKRIDYILLGIEPHYKVRFKNKAQEPMMNEVIDLVCSHIMIKGFADDDFVNIHFTYWVKPKILSLFYPGRHEFRKPSVSPRRLSKINCVLNYSAKNYKTFPSKDYNTIPLHNIVMSLD